MDEMDDDQKGRKMAIKSLIAHLGYDDDEDEDDGMAGMMKDSMSNLAKKKGKGGGGMKLPMGGEGAGSSLGGFDLGSLTSLI